MNTVFFTSDLHFGHVNICEYSGRPFAHGPDGVEEMNEQIIENWNEDVGPDDLVYVLGDFAMGRIAETLPLGRRLNGHKVLVAGNHDRCWIGASGTAEKRARWLKTYHEDGGFITVAFGPDSRRDMVREPFVSNGMRMHHFPHSGDSGDHEDRHIAFRPEADGQWLLHGHVHEAWRQNGMQINVGIDAWAGRVVPLEQVQSLIVAGPADLPALGW